MDSQQFEALPPEEARRLSFGCGPIGGPSSDAPDSLLQRQPGQDGGKPRRRLDYRSYTMEDEARQQYSDGLKKLFLNLLLFKARHPE